jgi:hypothetical protein
MVRAEREIRGRVPNIRRRLIVGFFLPWLCGAAAAVKACDEAAGSLIKLYLAGK